MNDALPLVASARPLADALEALSSAGSNPIVRCFPQGAIIVFDHDLRYLSAGGLGLADVGLSRAMLEGKTIFDVFPPEVTAEIEPAYRSALAGRESTLDVHYRARIYLTRLAPLRDEDGKIIAGMAYTQDVTAARESERASRESEQRFRSAFEHAPIGKALIDLDSRYRQVNPALCAITGYTEAEMRTRGVADLTHPDDLASDVAATGKLLAGETTSYTIEKRYVTATGGVAWVLKSASLVRRDDGAPLYVIAQVQDITARKAHENVLLEERRRLREAQTIGHIGSWEFDIASDRITWSDTLLELYGIDPDGFSGDYQAAMSCIHPEDRVRVDAATHAGVTTGEPMRLRYRVTRQNDGELRWFDARGQALYEDGQIVRLAGAVADVTDTVLSETEAESSRDAALEASRQKSAFLATMSHEIRTPMNAVIGMTGLLLDTPLTSEQRDFVETVRSSGDVLLAIINDILDFSKIEARGLDLEHQAFNLYDCVESSVDLLAATASSKGLKLVSRVDERCPINVIGDITRLRQVLVNLLSNAVKFTERGEVLVTVVPEEERDATIRLRMSVADTGIGIPEGRIDHLFESFRQLDASTTRLYGGTGLGLAISKRLVEAMGGAISARSVDGAGSTFSFSIVVGRSLPVPEPSETQPAGEPHGLAVLVVDDNATDLPRPLASAAAPLRMLRVLVAEDNAVNQKVAKLMLEKLGQRVDTVSNGTEAADAVRRAHYDLVLMDIQMPEMDGLDATRMIRQSVAPERQPRIVALTANAQIEDQRACAEAGMDGYLAKPLRLRDLSAALRDAPLSAATAV